MEGSGSLKDESMEVEDNSSRIQLNTDIILRPFPRAQESFVARAPWQPNATPENVVEFYEMVKRRIGHMPFYWAEFNNTMNMCSTSRFDAVSVLAKLSKLFENHPDILEEFGKKFLPDIYRVIIRHGSKIFRAVSYMEVPSGERCQGSISLYRSSTEDCDTLNVPKISAPSIQTAATLLGSSMSHAATSDIEPDVITEDSALNSDQGVTREYCTTDTAAAEGSSSSLETETDSSSELSDEALREKLEISKFVAEAGKSTIVRIPIIMQALPGPGAIKVIPDMKRQSKIAAAIRKKSMLSLRNDPSSSTSGQQAQGSSRCDESPYLSWHGTASLLPKSSAFCSSLSSLQCSSDSLSKPDSSRSSSGPSTSGLTSLHLPGSSSKSSIPGSSRRDVDVSSARFDVPRPSSSAWFDIPGPSSGFDAPGPSSRLDVCSASSRLETTGISSRFDELDPLSRHDVFTTSASKHCLSAISSKSGTSTASSRYSHVPILKPRISAKRKYGAFPSVKKKVRSKSYYIDPSISEVAKIGTFEELQFFDKVKKALGYKEVYENFLRCLKLYNNDVVSRSELLEVVLPFLRKFPNLMKEFRDILGFSESGTDIELQTHKWLNLKKVDPELEMDIDYCSGKRKGTSYRALPKSHPQSKCSGRTALCKEVLNDTWVSFPSWSEESPYVSSVKTHFEEEMYRIEDERFELDVAIQSNEYAIHSLDELQKRINKMTDAEKAHFTLDDSLGASSGALMRRFIKRIYGDRTHELVEGLKRNPVVAVPIVLNRLRVRAHEWKDAQTNFNKVWKDQIAGIYPKSLDIQGVSFRQVDNKNLRAKTLLNEIETLYEEKRQKILGGSAGGIPGPHLSHRFKDLRVFKDATEFLFHHIKRQPGIYKDDRQGIEDLLCNFVTAFFGFEHPITANSRTGQKNCADDPVEVDSDPDLSTLPSASENDEDEKTTSKSSISRKKTFAKSEKKFHGKEKSKTRLPKSPATHLPYSLFFVNSTWYIFFRLFFVLNDRLASLLCQSERVMAQEKEGKKKGSSESRMHCPSPYSLLLKKIGLLLTGKIDSSALEEEARDLFNIHAYVSYTMDKVIQNIIKQMHLISSDEVSKQCTDCCIEYSQTVSSHEITSPWVLTDLEARYQSKVLKIIGDDNCYKVVWHKDDQTLTIQLLDPVKEVARDPVEAEKWSDYVDKFINDETVDYDFRKSTSPLLLKRNLDKLMKLWKRRCLEAQIKDMKENLCFPLSILSFWKKICGKDAYPIHDETVVHDVTGNFSPSHNVKHGSKAPTPLKSVLCTETTCFMEKQKVHDEGGTSNTKRMTFFAEGGNDDLLHENDDHVTVASSSFHEKAHRDYKVIGKENTGETTVGGPMTSATEENDDEEEDSIKISAGDLLFHLTESGMGIYDRYSSTLSHAFGKASGFDYDSEQSLQSSLTYDTELHVPSKENLTRKNICSEEPTDIHNTSEAYSHVSESATESKGIELHSGSKAVSFDSDTNLHMQNVSSNVDVASARQDCHITCALPIDSVVASQPEREGSPTSHPPIHEASATPCNVTSVVQAVPEASDGASSTRVHEVISATETAACGKKISTCVDFITSELDIMSSVDVVTAEKPDSVETSSSDIPSTFVTKKPITSSGLSKRNTITNESCAPPSCSLKDREQESPLTVELITDEACLELAKESMVMKENTVFRFCGRSYRMQYVAGFGDCLYRRGSVSKAKRLHKQLSALRSEKFSEWHRVWLERYVTPNMLKSCQDWLLRSDPNRYRLDCITVNNESKPPYSPFTKYKVRYYKGCRLRR